jgi:DNA-binding protein HU-beta
MTRTAATRKPKAVRPRRRGARHPRSSPRARPTSARSPGPTARGHHVILLAGDKDMITWPDAMAWAKEIGGDLPEPRRAGAALRDTTRSSSRSAPTGRTRRTPTSAGPGTRTSTTATRTTPTRTTSSEPARSAECPFNHSPGEQHERTRSVSDAQPRRSRGPRAARGGRHRLPRSSWSSSAAPSTSQTFPARASPSSATARTTSASTPRTASTPACRSTTTARSSSICCPGRATRSLEGRDEVGRGPSPAASCPRASTSWCCSRT